MDENRIRQIIQEELRRSTGPSRFGFQNVPYHIHNKVDSPNLPPPSIVGFNALPAGTTGVMGLNFNLGNVFTSPVTSNNAAYNFPTTTLNSEGLNGFGGGDAPVGTMLLFNNPTVLDGYWIFCNFSSQPGGDWHGTQLTVAI